jgi:hypothetical protein
MHTDVIDKLWDGDENRQGPSKRELAHMLGDVAI